jgi:L-threonylcarbamoyladenylate synthase
MNSAGPLRIAARLIQAGGVVAYPTESVFGLGCDPLEESAVERILVCKHRRASAGLIVLGADLQQIEPYISARGSRVAARHWRSGLPIIRWPRSFAD